MVIHLYSKFYYFFFKYEKASKQFVFHLHIFYLLTPHSVTHRLSKPLIRINIVQYVTVSFLCSVLSLVVNCPCLFCRCIHVLHAFLRFTATGCHFGIFKLCLFTEHDHWNGGIIKLTCTLHYQILRWCNIPAKGNLARIWWSYKLYERNDNIWFTCRHTMHMNKWSIITNYLIWI